MGLTAWAWGLDSLDADPDWLYQDGELTWSEANELRERQEYSWWENMPLTELRGKVKSATRLDSTGRFRKPVWSSSFALRPWQVSLAGDSVLRSGFLCRKSKSLEWGMGTWAASQAGWVMPMTPKLGVWLRSDLQQPRFRAAVGRDSLCWLALGGKSGPLLGWLQHARRGALLVSADFQESLRLSSWWPVPGKKALTELRCTLPTDQGTWQHVSLWNSLDSLPDLSHGTTRQANSRWIHESQYAFPMWDWTGLLEQRWRIPKDSSAEWFLSSSAERRRQAAVLKASLSATGEEKEPPMVRAKISAHWPLGELRLIGGFLWKWQGEWQKHPRIDAGWQWVGGRGESAELRLIAPQDYAEEGKLQLRGTVQGPWFSWVSLLIRWSQEIRPHEARPLAKPVMTLRATANFR
ncbi:MAG TPA: hypothetical protein VLM37_08205 [Fibrobacteraceae bacterium]|nr:hypothetical protein [Fibrobacteraceae bacterium]